MATSSPPKNLIHVADTDYLDQDKKIRGQNYVCVSFISPEEILRNKEAFLFSKYLQTFGKEMSDLVTGLKARYPDAGDLIDSVVSNNAHLFNGDQLQEHYRYYKNSHSQELEEDFHKANAFQTSVRGLKIRGVFNTMEEAKNRAELLKRLGDPFSIYITEVGVWVPWNPSDTDIEDTVYAESELNTLMAERKKNTETTEQYFRERKEIEKKKAAEKVAEARKLQAIAENAGDSADTDTAANATETLTDITDQLAKTDPWSERKNAQ